MRVTSLISKSGLLAVAGMLAVPTLVAGPSTVVQAEPVTIEFAYSRPNNYKKVVEEVVQRFEAENPDIRVKVRPASRNYETLIQDLLRSATIGQDLPDVAMHGLHRVRLLADRELVVPIEPFIKAEPDWDSLGFVPAMQRLGNHRDRNYALSFGVSTMVIHYNADLVKKAGGNPENPPTTWPGIIDLAKRIDALGDDTQGIYWYYYESNNNFTFHTLLQSFGGSMMSANDKTIAFDSPAGMKALQLVDGFAKAGMIDMRDSQAMQSFAAGKLGIYLASSSRIARITRGAKGKFRYVTGPLPIPVETASFPAGGAGLMMHTTDPEKQKAAWTFMKFAAGSIGQTIMAKNTGYMPGNEISIKSPDLLATFYAQNPNYRTPLDQRSRMTRFYTFPGENSLKIPTVIRDHLQAVVSQKRAPEQVMPDMVQGVQALLPK